MKNANEKESKERSKMKNTMSGFHKSIESFYNRLGIVKHKISLLEGKKRLPT